jgi:hypothetical protein
MNNLEELFERQAEWQRDQANLPWAEKLRLSVVMREAMLALRRSCHGYGPSRDSDEQSKHSHR